MNFGATSIIVSGLLRIQKADVDLLGPFAKKNFDFWWSGILLPPCFVDQKVDQNPKKNEKRWKSDVANIVESIVYRKFLSPIYIPRAFYDSLIIYF